MRQMRPVDRILQRRMHRLLHHRLRHTGPSRTVDRCAAIDRHDRNHRPSRSVTYVYVAGEFDGGCAGEFEKYCAAIYSLYVSATSSE